MDSFTVRERSNDGYLPAKYSWFVYGTGEVEREEELKSDKEDVEERPESTQFLSPLKRGAVPGYLRSALFCCRSAEPERI